MYCDVMRMQCIKRKDGGEAECWSWTVCCSEVQDGARNRKNKQTIVLPVYREDVRAYDNTVIRGDGSNSSEKETVRWCGVAFVSLA